MKNSLVLLLCLSLSLISCKSTIINDSTLWEKTYNFYSEPFFVLFYTIDGTEYSSSLSPKKNTTSSFSVPAFSFCKNGDKILARCLFKWEGNIMLDLYSSHQYFVNEYAYGIGDGKADYLEFKGWRAVSGTFSLQFDNQFTEAASNDYYNSFIIRFECLAENGSGDRKEVKDGRLIFKRNVTEIMSATDFSFFIYQYNPPGA